MQSLRFVDVFVHGSAVTALGDDGCSARTVPSRYCDTIRCSTHRYGGVPSRLGAAWLGDNR